MTPPLLEAIYALIRKNVDVHICHLCNEIRFVLTTAGGACATASHTVRAPILLLYGPDDVWPSSQLFFIALRTVGA